jgi:hypothetical protein
MVLPLLDVPVNSGAGAPTFAAETSGGAMHISNAMNVGYRSEGYSVERFMAGSSF